MSTLEDVIRERSTLFADLKDMTDIRKNNTDEVEIGEIISAMRYDKKNKCFSIHFAKINVELLEKIAPIVFNGRKYDDVKFYATTSRDVVYEIFDDNDIDKSNILHVKCHREGQYTIKISSVSLNVITDLCASISG